MTSESVATDATTRAAISLQRGAQTKLEWDAATSTLAAALAV